MSENRTLVNEIRLSEWINRPGIIQAAGNLDNFLRGLISQPQNQQDIFFNSEVIFISYDRYQQDIEVVIFQLLETTTNQPTNQRTN